MKYFYAHTLAFFVLVCYNENRQLNGENDRGKTRTKSKDKRGRRCEESSVLERRKGDEKGGQRPWRFFHAQKNLNFPQKQGIMKNTGCNYGCTPFC